MSTTGQAESAPTFTVITSRALPLPVDNIDTDQITPARFLRGTGKSGLGAVVFADWRTDPAFVLNRPDAAGARILVAGDNFGCGSSREHAPWALVDWGFRAVISTSFADIFNNNALKNGLVPVAVDEATLREIFGALEATPGVELTVDLQSERLTLPSGRQVAFSIDSFARHRLLNGIDELGYILSFEDDIAGHEARTDQETSE